MSFWDSGGGGGEADKISKRDVYLLGVKTCVFVGSFEVASVCVAPQGRASIGVITTRSNRVSYGMQRQL